ncbi:rhoptry neck protein ron8 [Cystoisospora suis]|uniref:Rhoptry neck protein ron8 n=1 Tax=Cystoisospora suis TaxID=483139 RepID=A0A2C6KRW4_9APIC|nr:rhoptry neck protein ron8 [Cystoisospora suis]
MATRHFFSLCPGTRLIFFLLVFLISNLHFGHNLPVSQAQDPNPLGGEAPTGAVVKTAEAEAEGPMEFSFPADFLSFDDLKSAHSFVQTSTARAFDPESPEDIRDGVQLRVTFLQRGQYLVAEIMVIQENEMVAGFRVALQSRAQAALLQQLANLSMNPDLAFRVEWRGSGGGTGHLFIRMAVHLTASAYKPSVHFTLVLQHLGPGGQRQQTQISSRVPIEFIRAPGVDVGTLKQLIAQYAEPTGLLTGPGSFTIRRLYSMTHPQNAEVNEQNLVPWILRLLDTGGSLAIGGDLLRNAEFSTVLPERPANWNDVLNLRLGLDDAARRGEGLPEFVRGTPGYRSESLFLPTDGIQDASRLGDHQPDRLRNYFRRGGETGLNPETVGAHYAPLFGPGYDRANNPLLLLDMHGNPVYARPGLQQFVVGPGETDPNRLPDHMGGMILPGVKVRFAFPDGRAFEEYINPSRPWADFEHGWKPLMAKHKMRFPFREPGLVSITVNGKTYPLDPDFLSTYPSLLHLLAGLSQGDPSFSLDHVIFNFGDKVSSATPNSTWLPTLFVLEDIHDAGTPWCVFEYVIPLTDRGTVNIKEMLRKGRAAAESPKGCNLHEQNFKFSNVHRWGYVEQMEPLAISWRGALDYTGTKEECAELGDTLKKANLSGKRVAISFHAKHKLTAVPVTEEFGPDGTVIRSKPRKPVSTVVDFGENLDDILFHMQKPFQKQKVPTMLYPYISPPGQPAADGLDSEALGPTYYHRPKKVRMQMRPEIPLLHPYDTFTDGGGSHPNLAPLNIPIVAGPRQFLTPIRALRQWLNNQYPGSKLPFNLNKISDDDLEGLADFILFRLPDGRQVPLRHIFGPQLFSPDWSSKEPGRYQNLMDFLKSPKNILLTKNFRIVVTNPDGSQVPYEIHLEPGDTWQKTMKNFFDEHPDIDPKAVKLVLYDDQDQPLRQFDLNMDLYSTPYTEAVDQRFMKGLQITLETPTPIVSCYQVDPNAPDKCLILDMRRIFCGHINPGKMRARTWNQECTPEFLARATVDDIDASYITGPDDVRARSIRDLLASAKNSLKKRDPALAARLKIPIVDARQSARLNQLLEERTRLLIKADKTLAELDRLRQLKQEIKQLQRDGEMQWARLTGVTLSRVVNGQPVEERVPLNPRDFYMHDKLWKVFKYVAATHPGLKFEHIYNFVFEVMEETTRQQWKKQLAAARKAAKKEAKERKALVDVMFIGPDGGRLFTDIDVNIRGLSPDALEKLSKGERRNLINQLSKIYGIPKNFFIRRGGFPMMAVSGNRWTVTAMLGLRGGPDKKGLAPFLSNPQKFVDTLIKTGGLQPTDTVTVVFDDNTTRNVPLNSLLGEDLSHFRDIYFGWKKGAGQAQEEKKKAAEEKAAELPGIMRKFKLNIGRPANWKPLFSSWLQELVDLDLFNDAPIKISVKPEGGGKEIPCTFKTFGELLDALNNLDQVTQKCPGLSGLNTPFSFSLSIKGPQMSFFKLYNRSPSDEEKRRNTVVRPKFLHHILSLPDDAEVFFEYHKQKKTLTPDQLQQLKVLVQGLRPEESDDDVITKILRLLGYTDRDISRPGRLRFGIKQTPTTSEQRMLKEGSITVSIDDFEMGRRKITAPLTVREGDKVKLQAPAGMYYVHYTIFSNNSQQLNAPCGSKTGPEVSNATWGQACGWCNMRLADLAKLGSPVLTIKFVSSDKSQTIRGAQPVTTNVDGRPMVYDRRLPGEPPSSTGIPVPIFWNLIQQPGPQNIGPIFQEAEGTPDGGYTQKFNYFNPNPETWSPNLFAPRAGVFGPNTQANMNVQTNPEAMETGNAYPNPLRFGFGFPNWANSKNLAPQFNSMVAGIPPQDLNLYRVFIQVPKGNGRFYPCDGVDIRRFMQMTGEEIARACNIEPRFLSSPFGVYLLKATPSYVAGQPSFPIFFVDRQGQQHPSVAQWSHRPAEFFGPHLRGVSPADIVQLQFGPGVHCTLTQEEAMSLPTWDAVLQKCGLHVGAEKPAFVAAHITPMYATPNVKFRVPRELLQPILQAHGNVAPEVLFRELSLEEIVAMLLARAAPGLYHAGLKFNDGTDLPYSECPANLKILPPSQIHGLQQVYIEKAPAAAPGQPFSPGMFRGGNVPDTLRALNLPPETPYGDFVRVLNNRVRSPEGFTIPGTTQRVGGTPAAGQSPFIEVDFGADEVPPSAGQPGARSIWRPAFAGAYPDAMPMNQVIQDLRNPYLVFNTRTNPVYHVYGVASYGGPPFHEKHTSLDVNLQRLVNWMTSSMNIREPGGVLVDFIIDSRRCPFQMTAAQLLSFSVGDVLRHCGITDVENSHSIYAMGVPAPGYQAAGANPPQLIINGHNYGAPGAAPRDFQTLFGVPARPGAPPPQQDLQVSFRPGPGKPVVTGLVPHDLLPWLQAISDKHGQPGIAMVLNFLNQLHALADLPQGATISIDTRLVAPQPMQQLYAPGHVPQAGAWIGGGPGAQAYYAGPPPAGGAAPGPGAQYFVGGPGIELLQTPAANLPRNSVLRGVIGGFGGLPRSEFVLPFLPGQRDMPVQDLLRYYGVQPTAVQSLDVEQKPAQGNIQVRGGSIDFQPLTGPPFSVPVTSISSADKTTVDALLGRAGQTSGTLTAGADPERTLALKITILHAPDKMTKITTPVGVVSHFATFLSSLTLWKLLPPLININSVQSIRIKIVYANEFQAAAAKSLKCLTSSLQAPPAPVTPTPAPRTRPTPAPGTAPTPAPRTRSPAEQERAAAGAKFVPRLRSPTESPNAPNPNLVVAVKRGDEPTATMNLDQVVRGRPLRASTIEYALKGVIPSPTTWHRTFWGEMAPDGLTCRPTLEFPYQQWMQTTLGELPVPGNASCLLIQQLPRFKAGRDPSLFTLEYFYHNPVLVVTAPNKPRKLIFEEEIDPATMNQPLTTLLQSEGIDPATVANVLQCFSTNINAPAACPSNPFTVDASTVIPSAVAGESAFLKVTLKQPAPGSSFLQVLFGRRQLRAA